MLKVRELPPRKIPRGLSGDEYFLLSMQYYILGMLRHGSKAGVKAIKMHSQMGREFVELWAVGNGMQSSMFKFNKVQYVLVYLGICFIAFLGTEVMPKLLWVWNWAGRMGKGSTASFGQPPSESTPSDLSRLLSRAVLPEGLSADEYLKLGKKYKENGWIGQSQQALRRAEAIAPANSQTAEESHRYLRSKVPRVELPWEVEVENINGYNAMAKGDIQKCEEIFGRLMKEYPDFEWPYLNLASAYVKNCQVSEAKVLLRKLLSINAEHSEAWMLLSHIYAASFDLEEAQHALNNATQLYSDDTTMAFKNILDSLSRL